MFEIGCIYCIENKINGKKYVGQTKNTPEHRLKVHIANSKRGISTKLYKDMNMYGDENFKVSTLEEDIEDYNLNAREQHWIRILDTYNKGLNGNKGENRRVELVTINTELKEKVREYLSESSNKSRIIGFGELSDEFGITKTSMSMLVRELHKEDELNHEYIRKCLEVYGYILPYSKIDPEVLDMNKIKKVSEMLMKRESGIKISKESGVKKGIVSNILRGKRHYKMLAMYLGEKELDKALDYYGYALEDKKDDKWYKSRTLRKREVRDLWLNTYYTRKEIEGMTGEDRNYVGKVVKEAEIELREDVRIKRSYILFLEKLGTGITLTEGRFQDLMGDISNPDESLVRIANKYGLDYEKLRWVLRTKWVKTTIPEVGERIRMKEELRKLTYHEREQLKEE